MVAAWTSLQAHIDEVRYAHVLQRLQNQAQHAKEWRDVINTYFARKSGIPDEQGRTMY
ncbi:Xylan alpha-(1-_2)-glucuronosidase [compost metagenome]